MAVRQRLDFLRPADPASGNIKATCCLETALCYWHQNKADISAKATIQTQMKCEGLDFNTAGPIPYPPIVTAFQRAGYFYLYDGILLKSMTFSQTSLEMSASVGDRTQEAMKHARTLTLTETITAHRRLRSKHALN